MIDEGTDRLALPLLDGVEVVGPLLLSSTTDKMIDEGLTQLFERVDGDRLQA